MRAIFRTRISLAAVAALVSACGGTMTLEAPTFPKPLVEKINVDVGLRLAPEMYEFSHDEEVLGRETWTVELGDSNASMFQQLFGHMFASVTVLDEADDPTALPIDALVETGIDDFEFSTPEQTGTESFAVWIRYRLKVYNRDGEMIANWPVSAYGKSETRALNATESLKRAAVLAMRDAAALMIMKLDRETGISSLGIASSADIVTPIAPQGDPEIDASNASKFAAGGFEHDAI